MAETAQATTLEASTGTATPISTEGAVPVTTVKLSVRQGLPLRCVFQSQDPSGAVVPLTNLQARLDIGQRGGATLLLYDTAQPVPQLVMDPAGGLVTVYLGATITAALEPGALQFDLDLYDPLDPDNVEPFAQGVIVITPEVGA